MYTPSNKTFTFNISLHSLFTILDLLSMWPVTPNQ